MNSKYLLAVAKIFCAFLFLMSTLEAQIIMVPTDYSTIQEAIDSSMNGDTVLVAAGTYTGNGNVNIKLLGKAILVMSESGPDQTTIDVENASNVDGFSINQNEDTSTVIRGFRIINARRGIFCADDPTIEDCVLEYNTNGLYLSSSSAFIDRCLIRNNTNRGIYLSSNNGAAIIQRCLINNNTSTSSGGGVYISFGNSPYFINCTIVNNSAATLGGGISIVGSSAYLLKMRNCIVWGNTAPGFPSIYAQTPNYNITYSDLENCVFGMGNVDVDPQFADTLFHLQVTSPCIDAGDPGDEFDNEPDPNGSRINIGAYGNTNEATLGNPDKPVIVMIMPDTCSPSGGIMDTIRGRRFGTLQGDVTYGDSTALITSWSDTMIVCTTPAYKSGSVTVTVSNNNGETDMLGYGFRYTGGAVINVPSQYLTIQEAIECALDGDTVLVAAGTYSGNGNVGIKLLGKAIVVMSELGPDQTTIDVENASNVDGFSVNQNEDTSSVIRGFRIINARRGIYCDDDPIIEDCILEYNTNGLYLSSSSAFINQCIIRNNTNRGIYLSSNNGAAIIRNCLINNNISTSSGGGIYISTGNSPYFINCTIVNNSAATLGGGISIVGSSAYLLKMRNCIVWGNTAPEMPAVYAQNPNFDITYCDIDACLIGKGNIELNPQFADSLFHLDALSPCIDAGDPMDGYSFEPLENGSRINLGYYGNTFDAATGFPQKPIIVSVQPDNCSPSGGIMDTIFGSRFGLVEGIVTYGDSVATILQWSDTMIVCTTPTHPSGYATVFVTTPGNDSDQLTFCFRYSGGAVFRVPSQYPTIQDAIDCTQDGDTVLVAPGTYTGGGNINIKLLGNAIVVMSEMGPDTTIIDGENGSNIYGFSVDQGEDSTSIISGFKIIHTFRGIYCDDSPRIEDCILENNTNGLYLSSSSAQIKNCTIRHNSNKGLYTSSNCSNAIIQHCLINHNSSTGSGGGVYVSFGSSPHFINCTISKNTASTYGGGVSAVGSSSSYLLKMKNCIVWGNSAPNDPGIYSQNGNVDITYSDIEGEISGIGNLNTNPLYMNSFLEDFHLHSSSPCIDVGDPTDMFNLEPAPNGGRINMGMYGNTIEATSYDPVTVITNFSLDLGCDDSTEVNLEGKFFGTTPGINGLISVGMDTVPSADILIWSDSSIVFTYPAADVEGNDIIVQSDEGERDTVPGDAVYTPFAMHVKGDVSGIWTQVCPGTYILTGDVNVPENDTLIIEPGVKILIDLDSVSSATFQVEGSLFANGTEQSNIVFAILPHQASPGQWKGITLDMQNSLGEASMSNCTVENAITGITVKDRDVLIEYCTLQYNSKYGIEFYADGEYIDAEVRNCLIQENGQFGINCHASTDDGSGNAVPLIKDNEIRNNNLGGILNQGIAGTAHTGDPCTASANANPEILQNLIHDNNGYAIECYGKGEWTDGLICNANYRGRANPIIESNVIRDNVKSIKVSTVRADAQHYLAFANPTIINGTFWNNGPVDIWAGDSTNVIVQNSIFWDSLPSEIQTFGNGKVHISYSNFDSLYAGEGNISADPAYFDAPRGDLRLQFHSPCIDAGLNDFVNDTLDFMGNVRIQDGNLDDSLQVDMGAIESDGSCLNLADLMWIGGMGLWNTSGQWNLGYVPNICSDVIIPNGEVIIQVGQGGQAKTLEVQVGAVLEVVLGATLKIDP